jgi:hypothetical protein
MYRLVGRYVCTGTGTLWTGPIFFLRSEYFCKDEGFEEVGPQAPVMKARPIATKRGAMVEGRK